MKNLDNFKKNIVIATIAIIAIGLAIAPTVFINNVAHAQANKSTQGSGQGTVICPSPIGTPPSTTKPGMTISFSSGKSKGTASGSWFITGPFGTKQGAITGGSIGAQSFSLNGFENVDTVCFLQAVGTNITIKGECGAGVTIEFTASNGERGTFVGNVNCS